MRKAGGEGRVLRAGSWVLGSGFGLCVGASRCAYPKGSPAGTWEAGSLCVFSALTSDAQGPMPEGPVLPSLSGFLFKHTSGCLSLSLRGHTRGPPPGLGIELCHLKPKVTISNLERPKLAPAATTSNFSPPGDSQASWEADTVGCLPNRHFSFLLGN